MTQPEILAHLQKVLPDEGLRFDESKPEPLIIVPSQHLAAMATHLRDDPDLAFDCLMCLSGLDLPEQFQTVYHLYSMKHGHKCTFRCVLSRDDPAVPSVAGVWRTADWHEREACDMYGIRFEGHPDPRRILCPDDWVGYPLRKDYEPPTEWHGIPLTADLPKQRSEGIPIRVVKSEADKNVRPPRESDDKAGTS